MKTIAKWSIFLLLGAVVGAAALWYHLTVILPDTFLVTEGTSLTFADIPLLSAETPQGDTLAASAQCGDSYNTELKFMGFIPVKTARVQVVANTVVDVSGQPFGIKMFSDGVMVVGFSDIYTQGGYANPAKNAGLSLGDTVHTMNGMAVRSNEDVKKVVEESGGNAISLEYTHQNKRYTASLRPVLQEGGEDNAYRLGMWVRDSSAGIGTLTFIDRSSGVFAGLGHSITDADTGESIQLLTGEIVPVTVTGYTKSVKGSPGQLTGQFSPETAGVIARNDANGVYGRLSGIFSSAFSGRQAELCPMQEVKTGPAQILATIDGKTPQLYQIEIEKLTYTADDPNKNMLIRVTDPRLLATTGGIVQGMSGSPILQDGRLVGAVTHVLVGQPQKGFGIFAENMMQTVETLAEEKIVLQKSA